MCSRRHLVGILVALLCSLCLQILSSALPAKADSMSANPATQRLAFAVGEQKVLSTKGVRSYSEGEKGIVDIRLTRDGSRFVLVGLKTGATSLLFLKDDGVEERFEIVVAGEQEEPSADPTRSVEKEDNVFPMIPTGASVSDIRLK